MAGVSFIGILLGLAALGSALIAGVFFAFSTFVTVALSRIAPASGIAAMQSINVVILRSAFMPIFIGMALVSLVLAFATLRDWQGARSIYVLAGATFYLLAVFLETIVFNVPLNDKLAAFDANSADGAAFWPSYVREWTNWNHVRTAASLLAACAFVKAMI
ncbi:anthrone oxygenase family protein [Rhizobium sp. RAF56]|jgi:uncharacterized membrane protein|uniref:anthrone oxygenase family protein n=1 Tax=Rhizobium sp. RAF56 TaxID=3233062 RepID=UPI003F94CE4F